MSSQAVDWEIPISIQLTITSEVIMKKVRNCFCLLLLSSAAWATPLGGAARTVIPSDVQQIISVDYRALRNSETAQVLKEQVLPESLKQFEGALKSVGINPEKDVEQLTFASYRSDQQGTQNMMRSALGDASKLADYETVKKRLLGSRYTMNFSNGVAFDLDVVTSDSMTATTLSSLVRAGVLYRKMTADATEKMALESVTVNSDSSNLQLHFRTDDKKFQALLHSDLFAAVSK